MVFFANFQIVFLHCLGDDLVVFVLSVHHDDGGTVRLQLLHDFKAVPEARFILPFIDFVLQRFDGGL